MAQVPGFPRAFSGKIENVITLAGPSSYTSVTPGSTPTGGQSVTAAQFGMKFIEFLDGCCDATGTYAVRAIPLASSAKATTWTLQWVVAATGVETTGDLSTYTVRLRAVGI